MRQGYTCSFSRSLFMSRKGIHWCSKVISLCGWGRKLIPHQCRILKMIIHFPKVISWIWVYLNKTALSMDLSLLNYSSAVPGFMMSDMRLICNAFCSVDETEGISKYSLMIQTECWWKVNRSLSTVNFLDHDRIQSRGQRGLFFYLK